MNLRAGEVMTEQQTAIYRPSGTAPMTWAMNSLFEHLLGPREGEGEVGVALVTQPPGIATPLHRHTREAEAFFVLEGSLTYRAGEQTFDMEEGDFVWLPKGLPHAFRIQGTTPARMLALTAPAGLLGLYDEVGVEAVERRLPEEVARWNEIGPRYGLQVLGPPLPAK
jgi:quercetin dioxygenase-like cupin family protein